MQSSRWRTRILAAVGVVSVATLGTGTLASAHAAPRAAHVTEKSADILGEWVGGDYGSTYTSEKNGKCAGTTPYGPGYAVADCRIKGDKLTFVVTDGPDYKSYNADTVTGNFLSGSFHDTNGTKTPYTMVRVTDIPTTTRVSCKAAGTKAKCRATVTYDATKDAQGAPTGKIHFVVKPHSSSCKLVAAKTADTATCAATVKLPAGTRSVHVKVLYSGDSHFRKDTRTISTR